MANQASEIVTKYEVLFAVRTGLTVLMQKTKALGCGVETPVSFRPSPSGGRDLLIESADGTVTLKSMSKDHLEEAIARGFLMVYELEDDEVVRCTPCHLLK